jgi:hypothetical protein
MMLRRFAPVTLAAVLLSMLVPLAFAPAWAQALRDPTVAPTQAEVGGAGQAPESAPGYAVIIQDGKPHLVVGTRLVPVGQKVGNARLERITETEIWFREGGQLRKEARFAGISRTVARPPVPCAAVRTTSKTKKAQNAKKPQSPRAATTAAPCQGAQP